MFCYICVLPFKFALSWHFSVFPFIFAFFLLNLNCRGILAFFLLDMHCRGILAFFLLYLNHLPTTVNPNSELISFDVVSLYTNISHDLGISAITFWWENKRNIVQDRFSKEFILETVKIILERNFSILTVSFTNRKEEPQWELKWRQLTYSCSWIPWTYFIRTTFE